nr:hypothetical protein [Tanacetum cinerariifolium]
MGRRENFKQGSKVEESAPKALMATDEVGCDWSYMDNEEEDLALVADQEAPTKFALMAKSSSDTEVFDNSLCSKACKRNTDSLNTKITELKELKKEKEGLDSKLTGFQSTSKDLDTFRKIETGLPEFANDTITDYSRPSPSIETDSPTVIKTNKDETVRKPSVKYVEMTVQRKSAARTQFRVPKVSTGNTKFPTVNKNFLTGNSKLSTADLGNKGKAGNSQNNIDDKGYWDNGCSRHMTGNISYLSDYEPYNGGYVSFGQGGCKITGKGTIKTGSSTASFNGCSRHMTGNKPYLADYQEIHDGVFVAFGSSRGKITGKDGTQKGPAVLTGVAALVDAAAFGLAALIGILPDLVNTTVGENLF